MNHFRTRFRFWDKNCSVPRRIFEWTLIIGLFSQAATLILIFIAILPFPGSKPDASQYMDASIAPKWLILSLGTFWWITMAITFERTARFPDAPKDAANLNQSIGRIFLVIPFCAFLFAFGAVTFSMPWIVGLVQLATRFVSNVGP